jgi:hypothetical protein
MEALETAALSICVFGSGVLVIFFIARYNYLIKKALAEKGIAPTKIRVSYSEIASIVVGISLGLAASSVFTIMDLSEDTTDTLVWSVILMGAGLGLFGAHLVRQHSERGEQR